jgi:hypothetical protein
MTRGRARGQETGAEHEAVSIRTGGRASRKKTGAWGRMIRQEQEAWGQEDEPGDKRKKHEAGSGDRSMIYDTGLWSRNHGDRRYSQGTGGKRKWARDRRLRYEPEGCEGLDHLISF